MAFRRWYAMKERLQKEGKWIGKGPPHKVTEEEGEPAAKIPKNVETTDQDSPDTDPEMPALEEPETPEGKYLYIYIADVFLC